MTAMSTEAAVAEILTLVQQQAHTQERSARRTWAPVDLSDVLDGRYEPPRPTVGARADGAGLFYPGRMHTISSESEGGKTWLALAAAQHELHNGNAVIYLDFEDDEGGVVGRLLALGVLTRPTSATASPTCAPRTPLKPSATATTSPRSSAICGRLSPSSTASPRPCRCTAWR